MDKNIEKVFERTVRKKYIHEAVLLAESTNGDFSYWKGYGDKEIDSPLLMASVTKLFTSTCIFILNEQGKLSLDDKITNYLQEETWRKLHTYKGKDHSESLTISHLLQQTSGLPDSYEEGRNNTKKRVIEQDVFLSFDNLTAMTKKMNAHFAPGTGNRAHYADINFDLLGKIIEAVTESPLEAVFEQFIFTRLGLSNTYLPVRDSDEVPGIYFKDNLLHRPQFIQSSGASGGGVSSARDLMAFLKAFFGGVLFSKAIFHEQNANNRLQASMYPIHYGTGYMRVLYSKNLVVPSPNLPQTLTITNLIPLFPFSNR